MEYKEKYKEWIENNSIDIDTKEELEKIKDNEEEIKDRFYKSLEFGTAGLRGRIGAGTNRMNIYTVAKATQGLANYIINQKKENKGVVIAYDSRNMSKKFSEVTANCLNANGIKTYIFESLRPVPELSFAVRKLECVAGVMITASHNPKEYNGYKVYWEDGGQIVPPHDKLIIEEVKKIENIEEAKKIDKDKAIKMGLYNTIGEEIDTEYFNELKKLILNLNNIKEYNDIKIVYTPLHGTGNMPVRRILKEIGLNNVYIVESQEAPDGNFSTVKLPNPEDKNAFKLALELAKEKNAELVLATDPDADRLGVYAKDIKTGEYMPFSGNMSGMLIAEYIFSQREENETLPRNGALITTIVSTNLAKAIAKEYKLKLFEVLTGFKYIGEKIKEFEENKDYVYEFGFEESYGCLVGTHARDKDAIAAVMILCEAAAYYKSKGLTLWDQMQNIYKKYGYYKEDIISINFEGIDGLRNMQDILNNLRQKPLEVIGDLKVIEYRDYLKDTKENKITGEISSTGLPKSNVLYYELENDNWCCIRPSGTEPKIKIYAGAKGKDEIEANKILNKIKQEISKKIKS